MKKFIVLYYCPSYLCDLHEDWSSPELFTGISNIEETGSYGELATMRAQVMASSKEAAETKILSLYDDENVTLR